MSETLGKQGEDMAVKYLSGRGYHIVERNYHTQHGEIDIIAKRDEILIFVEVKTARSCSFGPPRGWIDWCKRDRLIKTALAFMVERGVGEMDCRFDVITIEMGQNKRVLTHILSAFTA
jgi:putative endonuclease